PPPPISTLFPTRRSSDLMRSTIFELRDPTGMKFLRPKSRQGVSRQDDSAERPPSTPPLQSGYRAATPFRAHRFLVLSDCPARLRDRKSTRLNSSHVEISY